MRFYVHATKNYGQNAGNRGMPSQFCHFGSVIIDGIIDVHKENVNLSLNIYTTLIYC